MILSNVEIQRALNEGRMVIVPRPQPEQPDSTSGNCPYQTSSVDLCLADEITFFKEGLALNIDLRLGKFSDLFGPNSESRKIAADQPYSLAPGKFVLGKTRERVSFPIHQDGRTCLAARVEGKSSYARCGLLVHFTAPTIHSGFSGTITLELINLGPLPVLLYPDAPVCQLSVEEVTGIPFRNDSQFQHQTLASGQSN